MKRIKDSRLFALLITFIALLAIVYPALSQQLLATPVLTLNHIVSQEPVLGGNVHFQFTVGNSGSNPVDDKGYNLTISDTLPVGLEYVSASIAPTLTDAQSDGTTLLYWDNIADLEVSEELQITVIASIADEIVVSDILTNTVSAKVNTAPDNSGSWITISDDLATSVQVIDINMSANQSTAGDQATGAGEYDSGADWPYSYVVEVQNNEVGSTHDVEATITLPPGVAYLGNALVDGGVSNPSLNLLGDGSLELTWVLGTLTTAHFDAPVTITFDTAIPYKYRTSGDSAATAGAFAGPMSGSIIPEDTVMSVEYEATGTYNGSNTSDGTSSTPSDDQPVDVTAEYLTVSKGASPSVVGVGSEVTYSLNFYVSEYYTVTDAVLTDVLPDGMTYVASSASQTPTFIHTNTPGVGETTIIWNLNDLNTRPGHSGTVTFKATVDATYEQAPYAGESVVAGDSLTNNVTITDDWEDIVTAGRSGTTTPDSASATVTTRMPTFGKDVWHVPTASWESSTDAYAGDTVTFRLQYDAPADIDAKEIIIRDFLPRGMTYVASSDTYNNSGTFSSSGSCTSAPTTPTVGNLNGLTYLEWSLCTTAQGASWEVEIDALVGDTPNIQPGWLVANFGKLSGQNTYGEAYSLRDMANTDYKAPLLELRKEASPNTGLQGNDVVTYTVTVTNTGRATAYNLIMTDTVPANLTIPSTGGSASPSSSSYTTTGGSPSSGTGGELTWSSVASLAVGEVLTYVYTATVNTSLPAGTSMTNIASIGYNSRSDNAGHVTATTSDMLDDNTDEETVYTRGLTVEKTGSPSNVTIGDTVHWVITATVPAQLVAYWPVIEENNLPAGMDYVEGSLSVTGHTLDTTNHKNAVDHGMYDNGNLDLRFYFETFDNDGNNNDATFTIEFDLLVTGVSRSNNNSTFYNSCCRSNADNDAYIGWYSSADGYNTSGFAYEGTSVNNYDFRSPEADGDVKVDQPQLDLTKISEWTDVNAGGVFYYRLTSTNSGKVPAYDIVISDTLPTDIEYIGSSISWNVSDADGTVTHSNSDGDTVLGFDLDKLNVNASVTITYYVRIDPAISADLVLDNVAEVVSYSTQPGTPADSNGDGLNDERTYSGPSDSATVRTPTTSIAKASWVDNEELTYGTTVYYTLTVPSAAIPAVMYNVVVTDVIDSRLEVVSVTNGSHVGNVVSGNFATIGVNSQETIVIEARVPITSTGIDGDLISNQATMIFDNANTMTSNLENHTLVGPALVVNKEATPVIVVVSDTVTYTLTIENVGLGEASAIVVSDTLPSNMSFNSGSATLNGSPLADPVGGQWSIPTALNAGESHVIIFTANVDSATAGDLYTNVVSATGQDSEGAAIPADNSAHVPADTDDDDTASASVYGGPLTCTSEQSYIAYEDLKNVGWADWDYNDVIMSLDIERCDTPDGDLAVINGTYGVVARGAGFDHEFRHDLPIIGTGRYYLTIRDNADSLISRNSWDLNGDTTVTIFSSTKTALPAPDGLPFPFTNTLPEQTTFVAGYSATLTVVVDDPDNNPVSGLLPMPWDPFLYVLDTTEEVHLVIPGHSDNMQAVNGVYEPGNVMVGIDLPLAQIIDFGWDWPLEFVGIWRAYPDFAAFITSGGATNSDWADPINADQTWIWQPGVSQSSALPIAEPDTQSRYFATPAGADLDGDGAIEIVVGNLTFPRLEMFDKFGSPVAGWPVALGGTVKGSATFANLDGDSDLEIVVGASDGYLYALNKDGTAVAGYPVRVGIEVTDYRIISTPTITQLDTDGILDILVSLSDGRLYAFNADGTLKSGWPVSLGDAADTFNNQELNSTPVVVDLDDDSSANEVIVGSYDGALYAFNEDGSLRWRFESDDVILGTPAIADIDTGVAGLEIVIGSADSFTYLLNKDGGLIWKRSTGWFIRSSPAVGDIDGNGDLEIVIGTMQNKLFAWHHNGDLVSGWPIITSAPIFSSPVIGDIDGDTEVEIVVGSDAPLVYSFEADGSETPGWAQATTLAVKGSPLLINLDNDAALEVVVADLNGELHIFGGLYRMFIPIANRP